MQSKNAFDERLKAALKQTDIPSPSAGFTARITATAAREGQLLKAMPSAAIIDLSSWQRMTAAAVLAVGVMTGAALPMESKTSTTSMYPALQGDVL